MVFGEGSKVLCAAENNDNLLRQVRMWTRRGYSAAQIQAELDAKYGLMLQLMARVSLDRSCGEAGAGADGAQGRHGRHDFVSSLVSSGTSSR